MLAEERRSQLLELVRTRHFATLPELGRELSVSASTIRRDLDHLEELGSVRRIHGGVLYAGASPKVPHFEESQPLRWNQKKAIARRTAAEIEESDTLLLDGGSTTYEVARLLVGRRLHVVTNSLPVANLFASDPHSDLIFVGGNICPRTGVARGPLADRMLAAVRVRTTILSVAGITEEGLFNNNLLLVETERAMMQAADRVLVVADSSKFGRPSLAHLCPLEAADCLVVDEGLDEPWRERLEAAGIELLVAPGAEKDTNGRP